MAITALIISGFALLAAGVCLCLLVREKKRNEKRSAAMCNLISKECEAVSKAAGLYTDETVTAAINGMSARVENLEKGIVPDYEKALAAANAVNDFNSGITNILGFDPYDSLRTQREKERTGEA
jgi:hypothetical protein